MNKNEGTIKSLEELHADVNTAKAALNEAIVEDIASKITDKLEDFQKAIAEYNQAYTNSEFAVLRRMGDPLLSAIEKLEIPLLTAKKIEDKNTKAISYEAEPKSRQISLLAFENFCKRDVQYKKGIMSSSNWTYEIEYLCFFLTYRVVNGITRKETVKTALKEMERQYYFTEAAAKQKAGGPVPYSNSSLLKTLQTVFDAILYREKDGKNKYRATSHDVAYILETATRRIGSGKVSTPRPATMMTLIMDVLHNVVKDKTYEVDFLTKKDAEKAQDASNSGASEVKEDADAWEIDGMKYQKGMYPTEEEAKEAHERFLQMDKEEVTAE